jgi:hypothetical protein
MSKKVFFLHHDLKGVSKINFIRLFFSLRLNLKWFLKPFDYVECEFGSY